MSKIILISGTTASGKSEFAVKLAKKINGEIINADSMQIYKEIKILNTRPEKSLTNKVKHHLYGFQSVKKNFSTGDWLYLVKQKILEIQSKIGYINNNNKTLILNKFKIFSQKLYLLNKVLNTSSIEKNLKKGYAILKSENQIIKSIQTLKKLNKFDVTLKDGVMSVKKKL